MVKEDVMLEFGLGMSLGESPVWDYRNKVLCWIDIHRGHFYRWRRATMPTPHVTEWKEELGCFALCKQGGGVMATSTGIWRVQEDGSRGALLVRNPESVNRFNDGCCDPLGNLWVGTLDAEEKNSSAALYRWNGRELKAVKDSLVVSNGLAFSPDGKWMYHADSSKRRIERHARDTRTGEVGAPEAWIDLKYWELTGVPDGAAVDEEGGYWCALFGGAAVAHFDCSGQLVETLALPCQYPTMVAFAGEEMNRLYITTGNLGKTTTGEPDAGGLFSVITDVKGLNPYCVTVEE